MPPADHGTPPQSSPSGPKANADSLRLSSLPRNAPRSFDLRPDDTARGQLARELGLDGLRKLRFHGTLTPLAGKDWALKAKLGATLVATILGGWAYTLAFLFSSGKAPICYASLGLSVFLKHFFGLGEVWGEVLGWLDLKRLMLLITAHQIGNLDGEQVKAAALARDPGCKAIWPEPIDKN